MRNVVFPYKSQFSMLKSNKIQSCYVLGSLILIVTCLFLPSPVGASVFQPGVEDAMLKLPRCVPNEPAISPFWGPYRECNHT